MEQLARREERPVNSPVNTRALLGRLAAAHGVLTAYRDTKGSIVSAPAGSLVTTLRLLGAHLPGGARRLPSDAELSHALEKAQEKQWRRVIEPVIVAWDGAIPALRIRLPFGANEIPRGSLVGEFTLAVADGSTRSWRIDLARLAVRDGAVVDGSRFEMREARLRTGGLPPGYHHLEVRFGEVMAGATVISAPKRCWRPERQSSDRQWGLFAPTYSLRSGRNWGAGDLGDLAELGRWTKARGGSCVATLPLLATFVDTPFEPSPYRPVSRMFWNEFYLAPDLLPEWERCEAARSAWSRMEGRIRGLRLSSQVDYREVMAAKREVLSVLAACFMESEDVDAKDAFKTFLEENQGALEYARFRARVEVTGKDWREWRGEDLDAPVDGESVDYHLYVQWQMERQLAALAHANSAPLFLDLPVGVHPGGFDTWSRPGMFVHDASVGAPPDNFFATGQQWDSPPVHPEACRETGHAYFAEVLRRQMRHADYLRIDHMMSFHRLFWIPLGRQPEEGVYVSYPAEELYAVLSLESHLNHTVVAGEDLGTVPHQVRRAMRRRGVMRSWVLELAATPRGAQPVAPIHADAVASVDSHDTYPLAGFLNGDDIRALVETGQLEEGAARRELAARRRWAARLFLWAIGEGASCPGPGEEIAGDEISPLLAGIFVRLLRSDASLVMISLDDLLLETRPHNMPGTGSGGSNWRLKAAMDLRDIERVSTP